MDKEQIRNLVLVSIISADNDEFTEDEKQAIMSRMKEQFSEIKDWDEGTLSYVLEPLNDEKTRKKLVELLA